MGVFLALWIAMDVEVPSIRCCGSILGGTSTDEGCRRYSTVLYLELRMTKYMPGRRMGKVSLHMFLEGEYLDSLLPESKTALKQVPSSRHSLCTNDREKQASFYQHHYCDHCKCAGTSPRLTRKGTCFKGRQQPGRDGVRVHRRDEAPSVEIQGNSQSSVSTGPDTRAETRRARDETISPAESVGQFSALLRCSCTALEVMVLFPRSFLRYLLTGTLSS